MDDLSFQCLGEGLVSSLFGITAVGLRIHIRHVGIGAHHIRGIVRLKSPRVVISHGLRDPVIKSLGRIKEAVLNSALRIKAYIIFLRTVIISLSPGLRCHEIIPEGIGHLVIPEGNEHGIKVCPLPAPLNIRWCEQLASQPLFEIAFGYILRDQEGSDELRLSQFFHPAGEGGKCPAIRAV